MKISYNWLQTYFAKKLPEAEKLGEIISSYALETEGIEKKENDFVLDLKVLPDRAHYALSHRGIAGEISAILQIPFIKPETTDLKISSVSTLSINVTDSKSCPRYIGRRVENITVQESPSWLKEKLEALGQRSINSIVDSANYVLLDMGQPLHAFDADKVVGGITIRFAKEGEKMTTLDDREVQLDPTMLVICDDEGPLALAGIKGGKKAEVTGKTRNLIIEAANFDSTLIRKTSTKLDLRTDASKRFENAITSQFAEIGMREVTGLILKLNPEAKIGELIDEYPEREKETIVEISPEFICRILGVEISEEEIISILKRLRIGIGSNKGSLKLAIPYERLDLRIPEDIVEEVGRLYGYEKIPSDDLSSWKNSKLPILDKFQTFAEKIKDTLVESGFSEVFTYSLRSKGDIEIEKSVATDKNFPRTNLSEGIAEALKLNLYNAPLLGLDQIKIFEIGSVFPKSGEYMSLCIGIANTKGYKARPDDPVGRGESANEQVRQIRELLLSTLGSKATTLCTIDDTGGILVLKGKAIGKINEIDGVMELNLDAFISALPDPEDKNWKPGWSPSEIRFKPISIYPFISRDIAVFIEGEASKNKEEDLLSIIKTEAGNLLVRADIFDVFTKTSKEGQKKTSYAYSLIFQSYDRTLTDDEINFIMSKISNDIAIKGWEVR